MKSKRLLIISGNIEGRPLGGVTMHVHRLLKLLIEKKVSNYVLCDYKKTGIVKQLKCIKDADVVHIHASNPILKLLYVFASKLLNTKCLLTVHGKYGGYSRFKNFVHRLALTWCDVPILINKESYEAVKTFNSGAVFVPAFLPPIEIDETLPMEIEKVIVDIIKEGKPIVATNASSKAYTNDGKEIYGISFLVKFFSQHNNYSLIVLDPTAAYARQYSNRPSDNIHFITGQYSFCGLVRMSDLVVRNTATDGDSLSVKESLWYHKPTLVTDVVSRPEGVFLFKYNDERSFDYAIAKAIYYKGDISLHEADSIALYNDLYKRMGVC